MSGYEKEQAMNLQHTMRENQFILLPDGRRQGYAEYGTAAGSPVLFFHGAPGSRHIHADMAAVAARRGVRLIALERPGYGLSDPQPERSLSGWADDVTALVDALKIAQFAIIGFSMGSAYAMACASKLPLRVMKMALVGTLAPLDAPGVLEGMSPTCGGLWAIAQSSPDELRKALTPLAASPAVLRAAMSDSLPEWDKNEFDKRAAEFDAEYTKTLRGGIEGVASDFVLVSRNWGFPLDGIRAETHLWCGTADQNAPPAMADYLASILPNNRKIVLQGEGHLALYVHWDEILEQLV